MSGEWDGEKPVCDIADGMYTSALFSIKHLGLQRMLFYKGNVFLGAIHNCWVYGSWYDLIMHTSTYYSVSIVYCENYSFIKKYWNTYFIYSFERNSMSTSLYKHLYFFYKLNFMRRKKKRTRRKLKNLQRYQFTICI